MVSKLLVLLAIVACTLGQRANNGLIRKVTKKVDCPDFEKAEAGDKVYIYYTGKLAKTGKRFDSNVNTKNPLEYVLGTGRVIQGWEQGLPGTCPGESLELTIPADLGYGSRGAGDAIPPNADLIFTLTLDKLDKEIKVEIIEEGDCKAGQARDKDMVTIDYEASLADGKVIDSSKANGEPLTMTIGKVGIKGWDEAPKKACINEVRKVIIPARFAYGEEGVPGTVPPNATLVLEIKLLKIQDRVLSFLDRISSGNFGGK